MLRKCEYGSCARTSVLTSFEWGESMDENGNFHIFEVALHYCLKHFTILYNQNPIKPNSVYMGWWDGRPDPKAYNRG